MTKTDLVKILVSVSFLSSKLGAQIQGCLLALHYLCLMIMMIMIMVMVMIMIMAIACKFSDNILELVCLYHRVKCV